MLSVVEPPAPAAGWPGHSAAARLRRAAQPTPATALPAPCRPRPPRCVCAVAGPSAAARCRRNCRSSGLRPHSQRGTTKQVGHSGWVSIVVSAAARTAGVREQRRRHCPRPLHHSGPALSARFGAQSPRRSSPASMRSHRSAASWRRPVYSRRRPGFYGRKVRLALCHVHVCAVFSLVRRGPAILHASPYRTRVKTRMLEIEKLSRSV